MFCNLFQNCSIEKKFNFNSYGLLKIVSLLMFRLILGLQMWCCVFDPLSLMWTMIYLVIMWLTLFYLITLGISHCYLASLVLTWLPILSLCTLCMITGSDQLRWPLLKLYRSLLKILDMFFMILICLSCLIIFIVFGNLSFLNVFGDFTIASIAFQEDIVI